MSDDASQNAFLTLFSITLTIIAIIAFVALVFLRTRAQYSNQQTINQIVQAENVAPTMVRQSLTQLQSGQNPVVVGYPGPDLPPANAAPALLTAGTLSSPIVLDVDFTDLNGVQTAIQQPNATVTVVASYGQTAVSSCISSDGASCWTATYAGSDPAVITAASPSSDEVNGHLHVVMPLPYYAKPGIWTVTWSITPVDLNGVAQPAISLSNVSTVLRWTLAELTAIEVTSAIAYSTGGHAMMPDSDSDPEPVPVTQRGNIPLHIFVYGDDWTCSSGQTMPVSVTKYTGGSSISWTGADSHSLEKGIGFRREIVGSAGADWTIPVSRGDMNGVEALAGMNTYLTMIHVPQGVSGACSSVLVNIALSSSL